MAKEKTPSVQVVLKAVRDDGRTKAMPGEVISLEKDEAEGLAALGMAVILKEETRVRKPAKKEAPPDPMPTDHPPPDPPDPEGDAEPDPDAGNLDPDTMT